MKLFLSLAMLGLFALPALAVDEEAAEQAVGAWQLEFTTPDGEEKTPIVLIGRQYDELVAWYVLDDEPQEFDKVKLDGEVLRLTFRPAEYDGNIKATFSASLESGDACSGDIDFETNDGDSGSFGFEGKRIKPSEFDETDVWGLSFTTPDGEAHEAKVMALSRDGKWYGWWSSDKFELPARELTIEGDEVTLEMTVETEDGQTIDVTFEGTIDGDKISGDAEFSMGGESGSFPFSGKRES